MKAAGRPPLSPDVEGSEWQTATTASSSSSSSSSHGMGGEEEVKSPSSPSYRPDRHHALYQEGRQKLRVRIRRRRWTRRSRMRRRSRRRRNRRKGAVEQGGLTSYGGVEEEEEVDGRLVHVY
jgi:hypothetical protein